MPDAGQLLAVESAAAAWYKHVMGTSPARDLLRLYRVRDWLHFLPLPLAGWITSGAGTLRALVGGILGWGLALAYTSAINQAFDDRLDRLNVGKNPVGGRFGRREAILLSLPPAFASLAVVAWLSPSGLIPAVVLLVAATLYSAPPRVKRIPVLGTLWNIVVGLPGLLFAGQPDFTVPPLSLLVGLFSLLLVVSQLIHEAEDHEDDRGGGIVTTAILAGRQGALAAAAAILVLLPAAAWWFSKGLESQWIFTSGAALFAAGWGLALLRRVLGGDNSALRRTRLRYRYTAFIFGALVFFTAAYPLATSVAPPVTEAQR